jgi:hypothetical protein
VKSKSKKPRRASKGGNITQTVKISLGGAGGAGGGLESLYKQLQQKMGGSGTGSSAFYPSSPSYYRLTGPDQKFAQTPDALSGRNQAVPNNLVSKTLLHPTLGDKGLADRLGAMVQQTKERVLARTASAPSSRLIPSSPEPNRPISAVQSQMVAGRPIITDPSLPRQNPTGRGNYVAPYDGEKGAPDSGYFPQQAQAPLSVAQEQALQRQVGASTPSGGLKKKSPRPKK